VALTLDFMPKLIDCGLSKFIPADPEAAAQQSAIGSRGQLFGTRGYMCPAYLESGKYDAKSEIYSLGVLLAELLTGRKTGQDDKFFNRDTLEDEGLVADVRAGQWPAELVAEWTELVTRCLARPTRRVATTLEVRRSLQDLARRFG
jgi:serine/threonine protein kinase